MMPLPWSSRAVAQTPEGKVKKWLDDRIKEDMPGAYVYKPPGGMYGKTGTPDVFIVWNGVFIAIEVKAEGNGPTDLQMRQLLKIRDARGVAASLVGKDLGKWNRILAEVRRRHHVAPSSV